MKRKGLITTISFLLVIAIFSLGSLILPDRSFSDNENRGLQGFPKISLSSVLRGETQSLINDYASDQLIFRDGLITIKTCLQYASGKRDIGGVYVGKDGQYIDKLLESDLDPATFKSNLSAIQLFFDGFADKNTNLYLLPIPTSAVSVSEDLPVGAELFSQEDRLEQLKTLKNATYIDIYTDFANSNEKLYYKTDPHWTEQGAYLAYSKFCESAKKDLAPYDMHTLGSNSFKGTLYSKAPLPFSKSDSVMLYDVKACDNYTVNIGGKESKGIYKKEFLEKKDKYSVFLGGNQPLVTVSGGEGKGHLLVIRDSFASSMLPYLMKSYESVSLVDTRYFTGSLKALISEISFDDILIMLGVKNLVEDKTLPIILG